MNLFPHTAFGSPARRLAVVAGTLAVGAALAPAASAWGPREAAPVANPSIIQPAPSMVLRSDGTAAYLARGVDVGGEDVSQLVVRPPSGPASFASPFASAFGQSGSTSTLFLTSPDAAGNVLVVRQPSPAGASLLAPGADPAGATIESMPARASHVDLAPSGEAAAIVGGGSTAAVSFRAAGPGGRFDAPRSLDRAGNMRSYGVGITLDPDGGVFVVYRTEQEEAVLQAYAPPGEDFGAPQLIDVPAESSGAGSPYYVQSTNGRGMLVWSENVRGNTNTDQVWAVTRSPGGLLGAKSLVHDALDTTRLASVSSAGITDDGTQYVGVLDAEPVSGCTGNADLDRSGVIAVRSGNGPWSTSRGPGTWPDTSDIGPIATSGNAVAVVVNRSHDTGAFCADSKADTFLDVRLGQGRSLGGAVTIASESSGSNVSARALAVNASGSAILLTSEPEGTDDRKPYLYFHQADAGPGEPLPPGPLPPGPVVTDPVVTDPVVTDPVVPPLPAPGKIKLSGKTLVARGGKLPFEASCTRLGPGDKVYCRVEAILLEQVKRGGRGSAAKAKAPRTLGRAKRVKVAAGKTGKVVVRLNKLGGKLGKARRGVPATLRVTIRKGASTRKIERKVTLKAAKPKKRKGS